MKVQHQMPAFLPSGDLSLLLSSDLRRLEGAEEHKSRYHDAEAMEDAWR